MLERNKKLDNKNKIYFFKLLDKQNIRHFKIVARSNALAFQKFITKHKKEIYNHNFSIKIVQIIDSKPTKPSV